MEPGWPFNNRPPNERLWALRKNGRLIECETNTHPLGQELRFYHGGDFTYAQVHPTRELADADAGLRRRELLELGWTEVTVSA